MASMTIDELLKIRGNCDVWYVSPTATVHDALQIMADKDVGALLVMKNGKLVGIFSERDYARNILVEGKCSLESLIGDVMTTDLITANPSNTIEECMAVMTNHHFRHLPVVEDDKVIGVISIGDLVKAIISGQAKTISSLESYITGSEYGKV